MTPARFVGRAAELRALRAAWSSPERAFVPIYGRRRIGKSELILRFMEEHPGVYLLGRQASEEEQLQELMRVAAEALGQPLLRRVPMQGWREALTTIVEAWTGTGKLVLALDEFQWIVETSPSLPSVLQGLLDREWRADPRVMLIVSGSYIGFMEREVLGRKSPLFGRRSAQIHLQPFGFREARLFHPGYSLVDAARTWFVCGGVPLYLKAFDEQRSVEQNIRATLLDEFAPLHREPDFLLREELREVRSYYSILTALATGSLPMRELAEQTGLPARSLPYYLDRLVELRFVRRRWPLTGGRPSARSVRFVLDDALLRFWFRFVWPEMSFIARMGPERAFRDRVQPGLDAWFGLRFEDLCREALPALYEAEDVHAGFEVGEYWAKDAQIDVVGFRDDGWTDLGECRWGELPSRPAVVQELRERARRYPNKRGASLGLRVFSRVAPAKHEEPGLRWHGLEELYGLKP
ncbi:MAG: ATP-binding protein [Alphaproteobacteria bacterium]|nr:ATP-binding protein [Alphaproteobacteria bacterium]